MAFANQSTTGGASQPLIAESTSKRTCAPAGGSASSIFLASVAAASGSVAGGSRKDSLKVLPGRSTLPAATGSGNPAAPVASRQARQVLSSNCSTGSGWSGWAPSTNGKRCHAVAPSAVAAACACSSRCGGIFACIAFILINPLEESSTRSSRWRIIVKLDGTTPPALPECTPSVRISTESVPTRLPRSEVVHQN